MAIVRSLQPLRFAAAAFVLALMCLPTPRAQMLGDGSSQAPIERYPSPPPQAAAPPAGALLPFDAVMASASSQTAFTFDRSMLQLADGFFANGDEATRRVVAGLNSITVHSYRARDFARYDTGALAAIDTQYRAAGWKHLVNANAKSGAAATDLWLRFAGSNVTGVTVLTRGDRTMNVVTVDCTLRPLDLLHLSGHFGIPKVDEGAVMVPAR